MFKSILLGCLLALVTTISAASTEVTATDGWARASIPGTENAAAYGSLVNQGASAATLTHLTSAVAEKTELHQHQHQDGMMSMVHVKSLTIGAGEQVTMQPGGYHIMLFKVKQPLKAGESFQVTLHYKSGTTQQMEVQVRSH